MVIDFNKKTFTEEEKEYMLHEACRLLEKYPNHIPIICGSQKVKFSKNKFLASKDLTFGQFIASLRTKTQNLKPEEGLFFMIQGRMVPVSTPLGLLYSQHKDNETEMLYIWVEKENVFGKLKKI
jgi:hypothetical protein